MSTHQHIFLIKPITVTIGNKLLISNGYLVMIIIKVAVKQFFRRQYRTPQKINKSHYL